MLAHEIDKTSPADFKRLTGVRKDTFQAMVQIHQQALQERPLRKHFGRPRALDPANEVLLALTYLREYRTYLSIAHSFNIHETTALRIVQLVHKNLIAHPDFQLPGKKALQEQRDKPLIVDVTESQIERPKKNRKRSTAARRNVTLSKDRSSSILTTSGF